MKEIKYVLIMVLVFVVVMTLYYTIDRYLINDGIKGVNPKDILNTCLFLILPMSIGLFVINKLGKK